MIIQFILMILITCGCKVHGLDYENEFGDDYGKEWVLITDDHGDTHYVNLTELPSDGSRMLFGDVYFLLYTRQNADNYEELLVNDDVETDQYEKKYNSRFFNPKNDVKFVTHGWLSSGNASVVTSIKDAYLRQADINVIGVDWHELADNIFYPWAALSTRYVGMRVAEMIDTLKSHYNSSGEQMHLIGHSLGAHVMGYAGSFTDENVSRITGLDPARPFFEIPYFGPSFSLDKSDADFVDVLHTCGGILGYRAPIGHADFFPNNGRAMQPGCSGIQPVIVCDVVRSRRREHLQDGGAALERHMTTRMSNTNSKSWSTVQRVHYEACSHGRAYELFAESIESTIGFLAYPCESWQNFQNGDCTSDPALMGEPAKTTANGSYYLYTNSEPKYAMV